MSLRGAGAAMLALGCLSVAACSSPADLGYAEPASASPPTSPNWAIAAPLGVATVGAASTEVPAFEASPEAVAQAVTAVALAEPRTERKDDGRDPTARLFVQRSALLRFPDVISVRAVDLGDGRASAVLYSRSVYGYSDLGVNKARVARWAEAVGDVE